MAQEYGLAVDTSSLLSSGTERDETNDEICFFDLGPEPFDPAGQTRLPSDEWLDDHQQELVPGGSEPRQEYFPQFKVMPQKSSLLDMMRSDMEDNKTVPPQAPERALTPTIGFAYDYTMDEPPDIQRITETPRHSTPHQTLLRSVRDLGRLCNRCAHALHQYLRLQNQRSPWPYTITQ